MNHFTGLLDHRKDPAQLEKNTVWPQFARFIVEDGYLQKTFHRAQITTVSVCNHKAGILRMYEFQSSFLITTE